MKKIIDLIQYTILLIAVGALFYNWRIGLILIVANGIIGVARVNWADRDR